MGGGGIVALRHGSVVRVQKLHLFQGLGLRVEVLKVGFGVEGLGCRVQVIGKCEVSGFRLRT